MKNILSLASAFKRLKKNQRFVLNWYKDYKSLKYKFPINKLDYRISSRQLRKIKRHGRMIRSNSNSSSDDDHPTTSRRQRLLGLAKTARDVYIPKLSDSVSQLATGVSSRAFNNDKYDAHGRIKVPTDASITLYPTYTRYMDNAYHIDIGGWLSCPGLMTRKNRLILSLVKQIIRYDSATSISNLESDQLKPDIFNDSDNETIASVDSSNSQVLQAPVSGEDTLRERLGYFIARFIANAELTITVGSEEDLETSKLISMNLLTDGNGCFSQCISVPYKPSVVQVVATNDEAVFAFQEVHIVDALGVAVISDIDDTVKLTGVIGDKRQLLTNLLLKDIDLWNIPSVVKWYAQLFKSSKVTFHYVSNSPVQLFPILLKYFRAVGLPYGSMHLKQYTGNLMTSLMEPSSSRKKTSLAKLARDFPEKKFICVGDSGEYDFELYVDLAFNYPNQVLAIYIRWVEGLLSNVDDEKIFQELNRILMNRNVTKKQENDQVYQLDDLIDLSDDVEKTQRAVKLPPTIPRKPTELRATKLQKSHTDTELVEVSPPKLPSRPRPAMTTIDYDDPTRDQLMNNLHNLYYSQHFEDFRDFDERGANWIERIMTATRQLQHTDVKIRFFKDNEEDLHETTHQIIKEIVKEID